MKYKLLALTLLCAANLAPAQTPVSLQNLPNHSTLSRDDIVWTWQPHASSPRDRHDSLGDLSDWLALSGQLGGVFVPQTLTINSHPLSGNITLTASDLSLGAVENTALSTWTGSSNLATLGTVAAGVWHATAIADAYIASASVWNAKANAATTLAGYGITDPIVLTSGSYNDPGWLTHVSWAKIAGTPTTLSGYGISDAVPSSRTINGQALSGNVTITSVTGNAGTVTTNANLTGPITSTGNATAVTAGAITNTMLAGSIPASKLVGTDITVTESQVTSLVSDLGGKLAKASNLSDLANAATARTNLGLGSAAILTAGTAAGNVVALDGSAKLPAVDGSQLTGISGGGGSSLSYGTGWVQGYTSPPVAALPASLDFSTAGAGADGDTFTITINGTPTTFENDSNSDGVAGGNIAYSADTTAAIAGAMSGAGYPAVDTGSVVRAITFAGGSSQTISFSASNTGDMGLVSSSPGADAMPSSGGIAGPVTVVSPVSGKSLAPVIILAQVVGGTGTAEGTVELKWSGGTSFALFAMTGPYTVKTLADSDATVDLFASHVGESLTATLNGDPAGGMVRVIIVALPH